MTQEELNKIVEQHQHWIKEDCEGWEDMTADLRGADKFRLGKVLDETLTGYKNTFEYRLGQEINIKDFNLMYNVECASGFHFFKTRKEAEEYN